MNSVTLEQLEDMFPQMRAQAPWNMDGDLLWGYFFTDPDPQKLHSLAEHLASGGYRVMSVYETDDGSTHFLHVERVETHTPETLHARNNELGSPAESFGVETYDGMDVGPVSPD